MKLVRESLEDNLINLSKVEKIVMGQFGLISAYVDKDNESFIKSNYKRLKEYNEKKDKELKEYLGLNYNPIELNGIYFDTEEPSYLIPNINKSDLIELGTEFYQTAVTYGDKDKNIRIRTKENIGEIIQTYEKGFKNLGLNKISLCSSLTKGIDKGKFFTSNGNLRD